MTTNLAGRATAYLVDGANYSAAAFRRALFTATGGREGVGLPGALKVKALQVPGAGVTIAAGTALLLNRWQSNPIEAYQIATDQMMTLDIEANTSSNSQTIYIWAYIVDPQFPGQSIPSGSTANDYKYWEIGYGSALPVGRPFLPLASFVLPANTGTITNDMITDMRWMASPREQTFTKTFFPTADSPASLGGYNTWPAIEGSIDVDIPYWATHADVEFVYQGIKTTGDGQVGTGITSWVGSSSNLHPENGVIHVDVTTTKRINHINVQTWVVDDPLWQGKKTKISLAAWTTLSGGGNLVVDYQTQCLLRVRFYERIR